MYIVRELNAALAQHQGSRPLQLLPIHAQPLPAVHQALLFPMSSTCALHSPHAHLFNSTHSYRLAHATAELLQCLLQVYTQIYTASQVDSTSLLCNAAALLQHLFQLCTPALVSFTRGLVVPPPFVLLSCCSSYSNFCPTVCPNGALDCNSALPGPPAQKGFQNNGNYGKLHWLCVG
jgi:hypothetical protein